MKITNPTDDELNHAFAKNVIGLFVHPDSGRWIPPGLHPMFNVASIPPLLSFVSSADAVLPWLKPFKWRMVTCDGGYVVRLNPGDNEHRAVSDNLGVNILASVRAKGSVNAP